MSSAISPARHKPHVVMVPLPATGHINPMMQLAQRLASADVHVSFVYYGRPISSFYRKQILEHVAQFNGSQNISIVVVPDHGLMSEDGVSDSTNFTMLFDAISWEMQKELNALLESFSQSHRPPACIVCDTFFGAWPQEVADKFGIPRADFSPSAATSYILWWHLPLLISKGYVELRKGENVPLANKVEYESTITCVPGVPVIRVKDLPYVSFLHERAPYEAAAFVAHTMPGYRRGRDAKWVLINSCYELESSVIDALRAEQIPVYSIGPLLSTSVNNDLIGKSEDISGGVLPSAELDESLRWLDTQRPTTVLYVAFGTTGTWSASEVRALAHGIEDSQQPFLWVVRPGMVVGAEKRTFSDILPEGFASRTKHRSLMVSWAPQLSVLSHPSVGGFFTHCGWNSTFESICMGVPMAGIADIADQTTNLRLITHEWKVGIGIERSKETLEVQREDVERAVRALMNGEEGKEARRRAGELRDVLRRAVSKEDVAGSSVRNLQKFIQDLRGLNKEKKHHKDEESPFHVLE